MAYIIKSSWGCSWGKALVLLNKLLCLFGELNASTLNSKFLAFFDFLLVFFRMTVVVTLILSRGEIWRRLCDDSRFRGSWNGLTSLDIVLLLLIGITRLAPATRKESLITTFCCPVRNSLYFLFVSVYWPAIASFELPPALPTITMLLLANCCCYSCYSIEFTFCFASIFDLREMTPLFKVGF